MTGATHGRAALRLLCALAVLLVPAAAAAGGWANISVINGGDFSGGVAAGTQEVQVQVLQHGRAPVSDAEVSVVAALGDQRVEQPAVMEFRPMPERPGSDMYRQNQAGWPAGQEPVYVSRLDLPQPGDWQVTVSAQHGLFIEQNPVQFLLPVTGMPAGAEAIAGGTAAGATSPPARTSTAALAVTAAVVAVVAAAWGALRSRRRPA